MYPITFWLRSVKIGKRPLPSDILLQCVIYQDHLEIYKKDKQILKLHLKDILIVRLRYKIGRYYYFAYDEITMSNGREKIRLEPANPFFPGVSAYLNVSESKKLKKTIDDIKESGYTLIEANPYIRNNDVSYVTNFEKSDLNLCPEDFYIKYGIANETRDSRLLWIIFVLGPIFIVFLIWIILELIYP
jgi:hypothetical protein